VRPGEINLLIMSIGLGIFCIVILTIVLRQRKEKHSH